MEMQCAVCQAGTELNNIQTNVRFQISVCSKGPSNFPTGCFNVTSFAGVINNEHNAIIRSIAQCGQHHRLQTSKHLPIPMSYSFKFTLINIK